MGNWTYPRVEGILSNLHSRDVGRPSAPVLEPSGPPRARALPSVGFPESTPRLDVSIAMRRLPDDDQEVLAEHYLMGISRGTTERRRAIRRLRAILAGDLDATNRLGHDPDGRRSR